MKAILRRGSTRISTIGKNDGIDYNLAHGKKKLIDGVQSSSGKEDRFQEVPRVMMYVS
jgi:hypothetical protein